MKKKMMISVVFILITLAIQVSNAFGAPNTIATPTTVIAKTVKIATATDVGWIEIKGTVPEGFDKGIMVNLLLPSTGYNALLTLSKANKYTLKKKLPVGEYKLDFINVINDLRKEYKYEAQQDVIITVNGLTAFPLSVVVEPKNSTNVITSTATPTTTDAKTVIAPTNQTTATIKPTQTPKSETTKNSLLSINNILTIVIGIILAIIVLAMKIRSMRNE